MAQGDMNIANQGFPAFRADLNDQLEALVTNSSGATAPATTFPHQWWLDTSTTPSTLRQRNAGNDAWIVVGLLNQSTNTFNLPVAQGGTGQETLAANNVLLGNGTSAVQTVAPGTLGNVLTSDGTTWQSSALPIIQVKQAFLGDVFTSSSTGWVDITGLSVSITPSSTNSKILVIASLSMVAHNQRNFVAGRIVRDSTAVGIGTGTGTELQATFASAFTDNNASGNQPSAFSFIDEPNTTGTVVYKIQGNRFQSTAFTVGVSGHTAGSTRVNAPSSIILMEIK